MKSFTLIEVIIVIAVMLIITGLASLSIVNFGGSKDAETGVAIVTGALKEARADSQGDLSDKAWGVHLETNRVIIYADSGSGYNSSDTNNVVRLFGTQNTIAWALQGGGANVLFAKRTGKTANYGTITVSSSTTGSQIITVNSEGMVQ